MPQLAAAPGRFAPVAPQVYLAPPSLVMVPPFVAYNCSTLQPEQTHTQKDGMAIIIATHGNQDVQQS
jgi:hypothetical protein